MELYKKYRPKTLEEIYGNEDIVNSIDKMIKEKTFPHFIIFNGNAGCGKTTLCRIIKDLLKVSHESYHEINASSNNGIDFARDIVEQSKFKPFLGENVLWVFDEAHQLTKSACESLLKPLEDTNSFTYFIFSSSEANKLPTAIKSRATVLELKPLDDVLMRKLLKNIAFKEDIKLESDSIAKIIEVAKGSSRTALVALDKIKNGIKDLNNLDNLSINDSEIEYYKLFSALLKKDDWSEISEMLSSFNDNPEGLRRYMFTACSNILMDKNKRNSYERAFTLMTALKTPFYDNGKADLVYACCSYFFS